jgi:hypothetical protein
MSRARPPEAKKKEKKKNKTDSVDNHKVREKDVIHVPDTAAGGKKGRQGDNQKVRG